jgi:hypothetical protein
LPALQKNNNEPENKKKQNNKIKQETKKKHKPKKQTRCTPQGGSSGKELGHVIFWFLVFWVCLAIAEVPSRNYQCTCKRTVKTVHSEGVPFCFLTSCPSFFLSKIQHVSGEILIFHRQLIQHFLL